MYPISSLTVPLTNPIYPASGENYVNATLHQCTMSPSMQSSQNGRFSISSAEMQEMRLIMELARKIIEEDSFSIPVEKSPAYVIGERLIKPTADVISVVVKQSWHLLSKSFTILDQGLKKLIPSLPGAAAQPLEKDWDPIKKARVKDADTMFAACFVYQEIQFILEIALERMKLNLESDCDPLSGRHMTLIMLSKTSMQLIHGQIGANEKNVLVLVDREKEPLKQDCRREIEEKIVEKTSISSTEVETYIQMQKDGLFEIIHKIFEQHNRIIRSKVGSQIIIKEKDSDRVIRWEVRNKHNQPTFIFDIQRMNKITEDEMAKSTVSDINDYYIPLYGERADEVRNDLLMRCVGVKEAEDLLDQIINACDPHIPKSPFLPFSEYRLTFIINLKQNSFRIVMKSIYKEEAPISIKKTGVDQAIYKEDCLDEFSNHAALKLVPLMPETIKQYGDDAEDKINAKIQALKLKQQTIVDQTQGAQIRVPDPSKPNWEVFNGKKITFAFEMVIEDLDQYEKY